MELLCSESRDQCGVSSPIADPVFLDDERVLNNLMQHEKRHQITSCYFKRIQTELEPYMRKIVATWLLEVCEEEKCEEDVFPLAMNLLDRFLSRVCIQKTQLQLLATACLLISSKYLQCKALCAHRLVMYTDYSVSLDELLGWELLVLSRLEWDVQAVTANDFLNLMLRRIHRLTDDKRTLVKKHAQIFVTLCTAEVRFFIDPPSHIACACLALALHGLSSENDLQETLSMMQQVTGIDSKKINMTIDELDCLVTSNRLRSLDESSHLQSSNITSGQVNSVDKLRLQTQRPLTSRNSTGSSICSSPTTSLTYDLSCSPLSDTLLVYSPLSSSISSLVDTGEHLCSPRSPVCACLPPSPLLSSSPNASSTSLSSVFAACRASLEECAKTLPDDHLTNALPSFTHAGF